MPGRSRGGAVIVVSLAVLVLAGCSGKKDKESARDLKMVGLAMLDYIDQNRKPATKPDDLAPHLENDQRLLGKLRSGDIVVCWGATLSDLAKKPGGVPGHVFAYERDAPTKGGYVVMGDMEVRKVTADEFKGLKLAEAEKK